MCFVSAVLDQYRPHFPHPNQWLYVEPVNPQVTQVIDPKELHELIDSFRAAVEAAEIFDHLTGQPDCADPEKAQLEDRVAKLERRLAELK